MDVVTRELHGALAVWCAHAAARAASSFGLRAAGLGPEDRGVGAPLFARGVATPRGVAIPDPIRGVPGADCGIATVRWGELIATVDGRRAGLDIL